MDALTDAPAAEAARLFARTPVALLVGLMLQAGAAQAQSEPTGLQLRQTDRLQEVIPDAQRQAVPTFVSGDEISGQTELQTVVEGHAELRRADTVIRADRMEYHQPSDLAKARGHVRINRAGNVYEGDALELKVDSFEGFFTQPRYELLNNQAHGEARQVDFLGRDRLVVHQGTYTTCRRTGGPDWMPAWLLRADAVTLDQQEDVGVAENGVLEFHGTPVLRASSLSFPLSDARKSGLLPPTVGISSRSGIEYIQGMYWNIAPNRDATLYPTLLSKRGVDLLGEFRYLEPDYKGQIRANYMPSDKLRDMDRWGLSAQHNGLIETGVAGIGPVALGLNLNRVSDDNYWRDFTRTSRSLTQRLLPNDVNLSWTRGDWFAQFRTLRWQTLQDVTAPIVPPYDRAPQMLARYTRSNVGGFDFMVEGDYTQFRADRSLTGQTNGQRAYTVAQMSRPFLAPGWFFTPKVQMHATTYQFDEALLDGRTSASRVLPTFSLDAGLIFERDASFFGRAYRQTLEPRAFYVHTPYRNQSLLPNYDSASNDFNFATVFTENAFGGQDRISDSQLLTLGLTTRFLAPDTGAEIARFGVAQRLRFKDQLVTLPGGVPVTDRLSDLLLGAAVNWAPSWMLDTTVQFNPDSQRSIRSSISGRYSPSNYRVVSAAYRFQRDTSEQIDVGWQWPLNDLWGDRGQDLGPGRGLGPGRWYSVGRTNYSMRDRKMVDAIFGFEYDADCWLGRVVLERLHTTTASSNTRILFQIEFVGFSRIGSSPLQSLRQNIPRYQYLREQITAPSRFSNYD